MIAKLVSNAPLSPKAAMALDIGEAWPYVPSSIKNALCSASMENVYARFYAMYFKKEIDLKFLVRFTVWLFIFFASLQVQLDVQHCRLLLLVCCNLEIFRDKWCMMIECVTLPTVTTLWFWLVSAILSMMLPISSNVLQPI